MRILINGEAREFTSAPHATFTCQQLIEQMQLVGKRVALERNGEIVPRSRYAETPLADGDQLEIVVAVGGG